jgi:hypothetical protein
LVEHGACKSAIENRQISNWESPGVTFILWEDGKRQRFGLAQTFRSAVRYRQRRQRRPKGLRQPDRDKLRRLVLRGSKRERNFKRQKAKGKCETTNHLIFAICHLPFFHIWR